MWNTDGQTAAGEPLALRISNEATLNWADGAWVVRSISGNQRVFDWAEPIALLPFLERDFHEATDEITSWIQALPPRLAGQLLGFRSLKIAEAALRSRMDYWVDLALEWYEEADLRELDFVALNEFIGSGQSSQRASHRARKLLRGYTGSPRSAPDCPELPLGDREKGEG